MEEPRGILIPIGGGEDKAGRKTILNRILDETGRRRPIVEVVTAATEHPEEVGDDYIAAFRDLGIDDVGTIYIEEREEAFDDDLLDRIERCDLVFFSGGNQLKLTTVLGGTDFIRIIKERYFEERDFVIAGSSAGAVAMSDTMIVSGKSRDALIKGELQLTNGLDFINNVFIDTHFTERGRIGRLLQTVASNPNVLGLGLGEDTGAIIYEGCKLEIIGSGLVVIADGQDIKYSDLTEVEKGQPISIEGITLHVLGEGKRFNLDTREFIRKKHFHNGD
jgi:cyanophycinase